MENVFFLLIYVLTNNILATTTNVTSTPLLDLPHVELRGRLRRNRRVLRDHLLGLHALLLRAHGAPATQGAHEVFPGLLEPARVRHPHHGHRRYRHVRHEETLRRLRHEAARRKRIR